jgi:hypothetical protein
MVVGVGHAGLPRAVLVLGYLALLLTLALVLALWVHLVRADVRSAAT